MKKTTLAFVIFFHTVFSAEASCRRGLDLENTFQSVMHTEIKYLFCLHNQQNDFINDQNRIISEQADEIIYLIREIEGMRDAIANQKYEIDKIKRKIN